MSHAVYTEDIDDLNEIPVEIKFKELNNGLEEFQGDEVMMAYMEKFLGISEGARESDANEKKMTLLEGLKTYPKAAMWSIILSSVLIMEGYDTNLLGSFYAFQPFAKKYGELTDKGIYEISAPWQIGLGMCANIGEIIGLQFAGTMGDRVGYRWTMIFALFLVTCFIFILFFAENVQTIAAAEILCGIPWGFFQTLTVSYATEVCPLVLRYYLTTYVNVCWVFGQLISSGVLKGLQGNNTHWAYRIPFAVQWAYPVPLAIAIYFAPEGPYWLVKKRRFEEARKSLLRLMTKNEHNPNPELVAEVMVSKMNITIEREKTMSEGYSYWSCFRGAEWRRSRIAILTWVTQNWTGGALVGYSTYFYEKAGLDPSNAFTFSIVQYCLGIVGTLLSWAVSNKFGRFEIYFTGLSIQTVLLFIIGGLGCAPASNKSASWGIGSLLLIYVFIYDTSVGPVTYCMVGELPAAKVRTKTIVLARNFYNLAGIINAIWTPYMLNSTKWNWGAKTGFFWRGISCIFLVWMWFEMPETKGRTYAELDLLFENKVKARDFKKTEIDPFEAAALVHKLEKDQIGNIINGGRSEDA